LNLLGRHEPEIYGKVSFENYFAVLKNRYREIDLHYRHTNIEGELIDILHHEDIHSDHIILNAGAYTHTSVALGDAVKAIHTPVVEVHISNIYSREVFRSHSCISASAAGIIAGCGMEGYRLALEFCISSGSDAD